MVVILLLNQGYVFLSFMTFTTKQNRLFDLYKVF